MPNQTQDRYTQVARELFNTDDPTREQIAIAKKILYPTLYRRK